MLPQSLMASCVDLDPGCPEYMKAGDSCDSEWAKTHCFRSCNKCAGTEGAGTTQAEITGYAWLDIRIGTAPPQRVVVGLYGKAAPLAVSNFKGLITCAKPGPEYCYKASEFKRIIEGFIVQGGWLKADGTQMRGFEGDAFKDDPGGLRLKHIGQGVVQMGNRGPDTNGPSFVFMVGAAPHLDGKHVVFGVVIQGLQHVLAASRVPTRNEQPVDSQRVVVEDCGMHTLAHGI